MRICIDCNLITDVAAEPDTNLCPRCYRNYIKGQLMNLPQVAQSAKNWTKTDARVSAKRLNQHAILLEAINRMESRNVSTTRTE
jgi:hypothetical protein